MLIYTVCTNDYDVVHPAPKYSGYEYRLYTDNPNIEAPGWEIVEIPKEKNPVKQQRALKIISPEEPSIYIDASFQIIANPEPLLKFSGIMMGIHPNRKSFIEEMEAVITRGKDRPEIVRKQIAKYIEEGMPLNHGLWQTGVIFRNGNVKELEEVWLKEVQEHSHRDQLSLPYASWKTDTRIVPIDVKTLYKYFKLHKHKTHEPLKIVYLNAYSLDKNIGGALNDHIRHIPDDYWIVVRDGDSQFLTPDWGVKVNNALATDGSRFGLIGCYTNRLKGLHQLHEGKISNDHNILNHYKIALTYNDPGIEPIKEGVAGVFMAFRKSTWRQVGGFQEKSITFDTDFNKKIRKLGMKLGLIRGLYIYHAYRPWNDHPAGDTKHLE